MVEFKKAIERLGFAEEFVRANSEKHLRAFWVVEGSTVELVGLVSKRYLTTPFGDYCQVGSSSSFFGRFFGLLPMRPFPKRRPLPGG